MSYDNTNILFASLVGSRIDIPRFNAVQNELMKHVLPPIPFLPLKNKERYETSPAKITGDVWEDKSFVPENEQFFPFYFTDDAGNKWLLPYEPMISISGKNEIVTRSVAKAKSTNETGAMLGGTIKERWNRGDYEITITGVLIGSLMTGSLEGTFPRKDFIKLRDFMIAQKSLRVYCEPLQLLGINQIVVTEFNFPFTKGENVQAYEIKALSDYDYKLLLDIND